MANAVKKNSIYIVGNRKGKINRIEKMREHQRLKRAGKNKDKQSRKKREERA